MSNFQTHLDSLAAGTLTQAEVKADASLSQAERDTLYTGVTVATVAVANGNLDLSIAAGRVPGYLHVNQVAANVDSAADTREDVNDLGGVLKLPATADITHMAQDLHQATATGKEIVVQGLDIDWNMVTQTVALGDTDTSAPVPLPTPLRRIHLAYSVSDEVLADSIYFYDVATTVQYAVIQAVNNQTMIGAFTVPAGYTAYMTRLSGSVRSETGETPKSTEFKLWSADNELGLPFRLRVVEVVPQDGAGFSLSPSPYMAFPEKTDIKVSAYAVAEKGHVHASFDLILIPN